MRARWFITMMLVVCLALPARVVSTAAPVEESAEEGSRDGVSAMGMSQQRMWPKLLAGQLGGAASAVAVEGERVYIGVGPRLIVLDGSDPADLEVLGQTRVLPSAGYYH